MLIELFKLISIFLLKIMHYKSVRRAFDINKFLSILNLQLIFLIDWFDRLENFPSFTHFAKIINIKRRSIELETYIKAAPHLYY